MFIGPLYVSLYARIDDKISKAQFAPSCAEDDVEPLRAALAFYLLC